MTACPPLLVLTMRTFFLSAILSLMLNLQTLRLLGLESRGGTEERLEMEMEMEVRGERKEEVEEAREDEKERENGGSDEDEDDVLS